MTFPLISPDWNFALWAVLIGVAGFGFWADSTRIGKQVSGVGIMLVIAMLLGNFGNSCNIGVNTAHLCLALTISLAIGAIGYGIAGVLNIPNYGILFITAITLLVANVFHEQLENLHGAFQTGMIMMYVFFATIGAGADVAVMIEAGVMIFLYASFIIVVHLVVIVLGAKLFRMDLAEIVIASRACIGGPVAPAAISASRGWRTLVTPGIMVGILGYAIANFIGVGLASVLAP